MELNHQIKAHKVSESAFQAESKQKSLDLTHKLEDEKRVLQSKMYLIYFPMTALSIAYCHSVSCFVFVEQIHSGNRTRSATAWDHSLTVSECCAATNNVCPSLMGLYESQSFQWILNTAESIWKSRSTDRTSRSGNAINCKLRMIDSEKPCILKLSLSLFNDHEVHYILTDFHQFHGTAKRERAKRSNTLHVVSWLKGSYKFWKTIRISFNDNVPSYSALRKKWKWNLNRIGLIWRYVGNVDRCLFFKE